MHTEVPAYKLPVVRVGEVKNQKEERSLLMQDPLRIVTLHKEDTETVIQTDKGGGGTSSALRPGERAGESREKRQ